MNASTNNAPLFSYPFLSTPPSPSPKSHKKQRSTPAALPVPPVLVNLPYPPPDSPKSRSSTFASISNWAAHVTPGSPTPSSPPGSATLCASRRGSVVSITVSRRPSISLTKRPSASFLNLHTPSDKDSRDNFDLTALGYTSNFIHLPKTPETPEEFIALAQHNKDTKDIPPVPPVPKSANGLKSFKSLAALRPFRARAKSHSASPDDTMNFIKKQSQSSVVPPVPSLPDAAKGHKKSLSNGLGLLRNKSATADCSAAKRSSKSDVPTKKNLPPSLAAEAALIRALDGGSKHRAVQRALEEQAVHSGAATKHHHHHRRSGMNNKLSNLENIEAPIRDANGQYWRDSAEKAEYSKLLGAPASPQSSSGGSWAKFTRRGSISQASSKESSFGFVVQPSDPSAYVRVPAMVSSGPGAQYHSSSKHHRRRPAPLDLNPNARHEFFQGNFIPQTAV